MTALVRPHTRRLAIDNCHLFSPGIAGEVSIIVDVTGSMSHVIELLKKFLVKYMNITYGSSVTKMGLVALDDHYPTGAYPTDAHPVLLRSQVKNPNGFVFADSTTDWKTYQKWIEHMPRGNGGDGPEEWACCIAKARELTPNGAIWLMSDAPPHGVWTREWGDNWAKGCPLGTTFDVFKDVNVLFFTHQGSQDEDMYRRLVNKTNVQLWLADASVLDRTMHV